MQPVVQSHSPAGACCALLDPVRTSTLSLLEVCKKNLENLRDVMVTMPRVGEVTSQSLFVAFCDFVSS